MTEVIRLNPDSREAYERRADLHSRKNDTDRAIADMTEVIRLNSKSREAYERRADLYRRKHDTEKAAADTARAARLPNYGPYPAPSYNIFDYSKVTH